MSQNILITENNGYGTRSNGKYCIEETSLKPISLYGNTSKARRM